MDLQDSFANKLYSSQHNSMFLSLVFNNMFLTTFWAFISSVFFFNLEANYNIVVVFATQSHESAMGVTVSSILNSFPTSFRSPSFRVVSVYWPWVPYLMHWTWIGDLFYIY